MPYCTHIIVKHNNPLAYLNVTPYQFPEEAPCGGWLKDDCWLKKDDFFRFFSESHFIFTKRIKAKEVIYLNGSSKHSPNSGSGSTSS
jgi:hypothetical protein